MFAELEMEGEANPLLWFLHLHLEQGLVHGSSASFVLSSRVVNSARKIGEEGAHR